MFNFFKKNNTAIQNDVKTHLTWDPSIDSSQIRVTAKDGIVTLAGSVPHYNEKSSAEKVAKHVGGVKGVADEMEVNLDSAFERSDEDLAEAAYNALKSAYQIPGGLEVTVDRAWVTLSGEVQWNHQRKAAEDAVGALLAVRGVTNEITLRPVALPEDVKFRIEKALKRSAATEARNIIVEVYGDKVTLTGTVMSLSEIDDAKDAAWNAPGVMEVENNLKIEH